MTSDFNISTSPQQALTDAVSALQRGDFTLAHDGAVNAIRLGMDNGSSWGVLALALRGLEKHADAIAAADRSLAFEARNPRAYIVKADGFYGQQNFRAAASFYRQALTYAPLPPNAPADLQTDMVHAQRRAAELRERFAEHLHTRVADLLNQPDADTGRMQEAVDLLLGKRQVYYPQPHHMMFPGLPIMEFYPSDAFDWVPALEAATDDIEAELRALLAKNASFDPYLNASADRPLFDEHGMAGNPDWGALYLWRNGEAVQENQALCPKTTAAMSALPLVFSGQRCPNVFFSRLKAGATIPPHTGMINTRLIGHLPLIVPANCGFRVGNDVREWQRGNLWLFDDTIEHEAWNRSEEDRIVLIFEVWKPELSTSERELVTRLLEAVDAY